MKVETEMELNNKTQCDFDSLPLAIVEQPAPRIKQLGRVVRVDPGEMNQITVRVWDEGRRFLRAFRVDEDASIFVNTFLPNRRGPQSVVPRSLTLKDLQPGDMIFTIFEIRDGRARAKVIEKLS